MESEIPNNRALPRSLSHTAAVSLPAHLAEGFYGWRECPSSPRTRKNRRLLESIRSLHAESKGVLSAPRIWEDLRDEGEQWSLNRVARLMRDDAIQGIPCKKRPMALWQRESQQPVILNSVRGCQFTRD